MSDRSRPSHLSRLTDQFRRIAASIEGRQSASVVSEAMSATRALCASAASEATSAEVKTLLTNVQTALVTWQTVWPRLGGQREFRQAVAREARLWARKLGELAHDHLSE